MGLLRPYRFAKTKADRWWRTHGGALPFPSDADEFLDRAEELAVTAEIQLRKNGKYWDVVGHRVGGAAATDEVVRADESEKVGLAAVLDDIEDSIPF